MKAAEELRAAAVQGLGGTADLAGLLDAVERFARRFVRFTNDHQAVVAAIWVAHVYAIDVANTTPYLRIRSAAPESGKSRLLEVLYLLLGEDRAELVANTSPAVLYRLLDEKPMALLFDETDHTMARRKDDASRDLVGLINNGYRRGMKALRMEGQRFEKVRRFNVFGPKALAGLVDLADTIESRCIPIVLERKDPGQRVEEFMFDDVEPQAGPLRDGLAAWAAGLEEPAGRPAFPPGLRDRQKEVWRPLLVIADQAGKEWPERARAAAVALHRAGQESDVSEQMLLLAHIRGAFDEAGTDRLPTADLLAALVGNEEGPWARWWGRDVEDGRNLKGAGSELARKLKPFGIRPTVIRVPTGTAKGYRTHDFEDVWNRYLPTPRTEVTKVTEVTPQVAPTRTVTSVMSVTSVSGVEVVAEGDGFGSLIDPSETALEGRWKCDDCQAWTREGEPACWRCRKAAV